MTSPNLSILALPRFCRGLNSGYHARGIILDFSRSMFARLAGTFDLDDDGVVEQPVEQRRGDDGIAEDLAPFCEAAVGGQDHGTLFVARAARGASERDIL